MFKFSHQIQSIQTSNKFSCLNDSFKNFVDLKFLDDFSFKFLIPFKNS